jgi:hypothetical protein
MWGHQIRVLRPLAGAPRLDTEHARPAYSTMLPSRVLSVGPWLQGDDLKIWCQNKEVNAPLAQVRTEDCKARNVILSSAGVRPGAFEAPKAAGLRSASPPATGKPLGSTPKKAGASKLELSLNILSGWSFVLCRVSVDRGDRVVGFLSFLPVCFCFAAAKGWATTACSPRWPT